MFQLVDRERCGQSKGNMEPVEIKANKDLACQGGGYEGRTQVDDRVREFKPNLGTL